MPGVDLQFDWLFENNRRFKAILKDLINGEIKRTELKNHYNFSILFEIEVA